MFLIILYLLAVSLGAAQTSIVVNGLPGVVATKMIGVEVAGAGVLSLMADRTAGTVEFSSFNVGSDKTLECTLPTGYSASSHPLMILRAPSMTVSGTLKATSGLTVVLHTSHIDLDSSGMLMTQDPGSSILMYFQDQPTGLVDSIVGSTASARDPGNFATPGAVGQAALTWLGRSGDGDSSGLVNHVSGTVQAYVGTLPNTLMEAASNGSAVTLVNPANSGSFVTILGAGQHSAIASGYEDGVQVLQYYFVNKDGGYVLVSNDGDSEVDVSQEALDAWAQTGEASEITLQDFEEFIAQQHADASIGVSSMSVADSPAEDVNELPDFDTAAEANGGYVPNINLPTRNFVNPEIARQLELERIQRDVVAGVITPQQASRIIGESVGETFGDRYVPAAIFDDASGAGDFGGGFHDFAPAGAPEGFGPPPGADFGNDFGPPLGAEGFGPPPGADFGNDFGPPPGAEGFGPPPGAAPEGFGPPPGAAPEGFGPPPGAAPEGFGPPPGAEGFGPPPGAEGFGPPPGAEGFGPPPGADRPGALNPSAEFLNAVGAHYPGGAQALLEAGRGAVETPEFAQALAQAVEAAGGPEAFEQQNPEVASYEATGRDFGNDYREGAGAFANARLGAPDADVQHGGRLELSPDFANAVGAHYDGGAQALVQGGPRTVESEGFSRALAAAVEEAGGPEAFAEQHPDQVSTYRRGASDFANDYRSGSGIFARGPQPQGPTSAQLGPSGPIGGGAPGNLNAPAQLGPSGPTGGGNRPPSSERGLDPSPEFLRAVGENYGDGTAEGLYEAGPDVVQTPEFADAVRGAVADAGGAEQFADAFPNEVASYDGGREAFINDYQQGNNFFDDSIAVQ